ncbi:MAG: hypothetical protein Kow00128_02500 [Deltaproteobacteria bacterium]
METVRLGDPVPIVELDLRGQICPATLLRSLSEINRRRESLRNRSVVLSILTTNRESTATVSEAAIRMGYRVTVDREDAHYRIRIEADPEAAGNGTGDRP